jgi:hypothetical protein
MYGVQTNPPTDPEEIKKFRAKLESYQMSLVCDPRLPQDANGVAAEAQVKAFKEAGDRLHAAMTGRRSTWTPAAFQANFERNQSPLSCRAHSIVSRLMGVENHRAGAPPNRPPGLAHRQ